MNVKIFASKVRQLILQLQKLKQEKANLEATIQKLKEENEQKSQALKALQVEYNSLMIGKILNIADNDIETSKRRINNMIRTIDKCITILSEK
jgi:cell division protein FtsB